MKILQLVNRIPYPLHDGGNLAVHFYMEGFLKAGVSLSMLAMNTTRHWVDEHRLPPLFQQLDSFRAVRVDNRIRPLPAFFNLFGHRSYNISRFISKEYRSALVQLLQQQGFDVIQMEGLYLTPYIPAIRKYSRATIVLRQHNAEFRIWERLAQQEPKLLKRQYLKLLSQRLKRYEQEVLNRVDMIVPISECDAAIFKSLGARKPMFVQSYGLDIAAIPFEPAATSPANLYHLGAMDWPPNREAIHFFLTKVMPLLNTMQPDLVFHLAGRNMPDKLLHHRQQNVVIHGEVPDADAFERDKSILVVPLLSGGGVRIKIFRAMAMGKAIVSTPVGMEGIDITNGQEAFIAKDAEEMAEQLVYLAQHPEKVADMGRAARRFIEEHHDQGKMIQELLAQYAS